MARTSRLLNDNLRRRVQPHDDRDGELGGRRGRELLLLHNLASFAADTYPDGKAIYTKAVARRMIQMTRNINSEWTEHVGNTGVTCYTCHVGSRSRTDSGSTRMRIRSSATISMGGRACDLADHRAQCGESEQCEADGVDLCADDQPVQLARRELHLLSQPHGSSRAGIRHRPSV